MASLPTNVGYGKVVGRFIKAVGDNLAGDSDVDSNPDAIPQSGTVTFIPSEQWLKDIAASPVPVTLLPQMVVCTLDANGYLQDPALNQGVWLIATDDSDLSPTGWNYSVLLSIAGQPLRTQQIQVLVGVTLDLSAF